MGAAPGSGGGEAVTVAVRCRPLSEREARDGRRSVVQVDAAARQVVLGGAPAGAPGDAARAFTFDAAFGPGASQAEVYDATTRRIVDSVLAGYNGTVFAYGQTGTGKTHTMEGGAGEAAGIIPRAFDHLFAAIQGAPGGVTFLVRASMLEIYNEDIRDLLSKASSTEQRGRKMFEGRRWRDPSNRLELHEGKEGVVYVKGLNTFVVNSAAECANILEAGKKNRTVGATLMNQDSSRSHSVFTITVETAAAGAGAGEQQSQGQGGGIRVGKLSLVDLAGSERQGKTQAAGDRLREAAKINLSLSALGNVISALVDGRGAHIPYRDSKLTRMLQDSLGGNTRTVMIANVGPADYNYDETLSTLRYANRAKNIQNKPRINEDPKDAMLRQFQEEIARLRAQLEAGGPDGALLGGGSAGGTALLQKGEPGALPPEEVARMRQQLEEELRAEWTNAGVEPSKGALGQLQAEVEAQLAAQVKRVQAELARAAKEAAKLERSLRQQSAQVQQAAAQREQAQMRNAELAAKLRMMESKLLRGERSGGLDRLARDREAQVRRQEAELRRQAAQGSEKARRIAVLEAAEAEATAACASLQEQADAAMTQLEAAWAAYNEVRQAAADTYDQFQADREELLETIRQALHRGSMSLHHDLALKSLVIDAFIPQEEVSKLLRRAWYDDAAGAWALENAVAAGGGGGGSPELKRPASAALVGRRPSALVRVQLEPYQQQQLCVEA
eukprot:scaffold7.g3761.t1